MSYSYHLVYLRQSTSLCKRR